MNRRDAGLALLSLFTSSSTVFAQGTESKLVFPGSPAIRSDLRLLQYKDKPFEGVGDKIALVYFGTAQSLPVCAADLAAIEESVKLLNQRCSKPIVPVFIYPQGQGIPAKGNLREFAERPGSLFIVLSGPLAQILQIANGYRAHYYFDKPGGVIINHTRFVYAMAPDGSNLANVRSAEILPYTLKQLAPYLNRSGNSQQQQICAL